jgi:hypothetical protein
VEEEAAEAAYALRRPEFEKPGGNAGLFLMDTCNPPPGTTKKSRLSHNYARFAVSMEVSGI